MRLRTTSGATIIFFLSIVSVYPTPGQNLIVKKFGAKDSLLKFSPTTSVRQVIQGGKVLSTMSVDESQAVNVIVELAAPVIFHTQGTTVSNRNAAAQQRAAFVNRLVSVSPAAKLTRQFSQVLNGASLSIPRSDIGRLASLSEVRKVYEDKKVTAFGTPSSAAFRPNTAQSDASMTGGKKIRVGVIDTGVDYLHEALGGGLGPGFKVAGGYDFVNGKSDPMDDNGHGTHVAGIIAGNSAALKSMAPDVNLFAYKVLDASGNGNTSTVIAGIEQAMTDSVDVINLSLGTSDGDPDDILSEAVDRAVEAGIVVVVAAGNDGDYGTISSPGAAREALTVGAIDSLQAVASFSSKGPSNKIYGIKPDVVAPGVNILSAKMGGGYITMSGTSMATPYVSAAAANLRQIHPDWTAFEIRDALIATARDLNSPVFSEGRGKVDTARTGAVQSVATPATLSFGFDNSSASVWTKTDTVTLTNVSPSTKSYTLKAIPAAAGIDVRCSPSIITIGQNESGSVLISASVNNPSLPDNTALPQGYGGNILAVSSSDTVVIPFVFFKGNVFQISFSETPFQVVIHDHKSNAFYFNPVNSFLTAIVPAGTYDIVTSFSGSACVVKENLSTQDNLEVSVARSEADHAITISPVDENGDALVPAGTSSSCSYIEALMHTSSGISEVVLGGGKIQTASLVQELYFSDVSSNYSFGYTINVQYGNLKSYTFDVELDSGITTSQNIQFTASDLKKVDFKYEIDSSVTKVFPITWSTFVQQNNVVAVTFYDGADAPLLSPFIQTGYYTKRTTSSFPIFHFREAYKY
ncbi:MAG TPA: S8 family serine peptidase [Bacteroidota bacterium]|nr:S8 family serine peptidase [Bacteroidota bacterium]